MSKSKNPGKAALVQHYVEEQKTQHQIAKIYNVDYKTIARWMREEGIVTRRGNQSRPDDDGEVVVAPSRQIERAPDLLGSDFHPVETSRGLMPLYGLATKLPEPQQKKVARLLTLVAYKFKKRRLAREFANHGKGELL